MGTPGLPDGATGSKVMQNEAGMSFDFSKIRRAVHPTSPVWEMGVGAKDSWLGTGDWEEWRLGIWGERSQTKPLALLPLDSSR